MNFVNDVHVKIAEVRIGEPGQVLKSTLGSCIGIAFLWGAKRKYGLAHCLLPESPVFTDEIGAKYVDQAIFSLIKLLKIMPNEKEEVEVIIAGGGDMMMQLDRKNKDHVGTLNLASARKYLTKFGFTFKELSCSGFDAKQLIIDCSSGEVRVKNISNAIRAKYEK